MGCDRVVVKVDCAEYWGWSGRSFEDRDPERRNGRGGCIGRQDDIISSSGLITRQVGGIILWTCRRIHHSSMSPGDGGLDFGNLFQVDLRGR